MRILAQTASRALITLATCALLGAPGCRTAAPGPPALQLVESWPIETTLDDPAVPDAAEVWLEMIGQAKVSLDIEHFYGITSADNPVLERVVDAVTAAAARGVRVRAIFDKTFYGKMPDLPDRMGGIAGVEVRILDMKALTGGVQHAKFFLVDGVQAFVGSQNFDWRALSHIQELGLRIRLPEAVAAVQAVFETDWSLAGGTPKETAVRPIPGAGSVIATRYGGAPASATVLVDPRPLLAGEAAWELPHLLAAIDGAQTRVRVQLLSYKTKNYDKTVFTDLDDALRRAAARGVAVELMVADWSKKKSRIGVLQDLQLVPNITVKLVGIPAWSGGEIPFARVIHSKLMTVDGAVGWIGTSNWSGDYFTASRNLGLLVRSAAFAADLDRLFGRVWDSSYAEVVAAPAAPPP